MKKYQILFMLFTMLLCFPGLAEGHSNVIRLISFYTECRIEDTSGKGLEGITVSLYCVDFDSGKQCLFFEGISDQDGFYCFEAQTDTDQLPDKYVYKLTLKSAGQTLERIIDTQVEQMLLLNQLKTITLAEDSYKKALIVDDEWVAELHSFEQKTKMAIMLNTGKETAVKKVIKYLIQTQPENAEVFVNGEYVGNSPIELTLPVMTGEETYIITIRKEGFETEILIITTKETLSFKDELIPYRKRITLKQLD